MTSSITLITGGTGFIGRNLVDGCVTEDRPIRLLVRRPHPDSRMDTVLLESMADEGTLDIAMAGIRTVVHLAARAHVAEKAIKNTETLLQQVNVSLAGRLAEAAFARGVDRFVFVSSIGAVSNKSQPHRPLTETCECRPASQYGRSKLRAEILLRDIAEQCKAQLVIIRPPLVHGKGAPGNLARLAKVIAKGLPLPLAGVVNRRSMVHVENLSMLIRLCIDSDVAPSEIFHVRDHQDYSTPEILAGVAKSMDRPLRTFRAPARVLQTAAAAAGRRDLMRQLTGWLQVDDDHARKSLGYEPAQLPLEVV